METTGQRLKRLRKASHLSQEQVGKAIGIGKQAVGKYENGLVKTLKQPQIKALAELFGVAPSYILCLDNEQKQKETEMNEFLEELRQRPEMRMLFSVSKNCTKEDIEKAIRIIEALKNDR